MLTKARSDRNGRAWHLALSGLCRGELCGLASSDIDLGAEPSLTIRTTRVVVDGRSRGEHAEDRGRQTHASAHSRNGEGAQSAKRRQAAERLQAGATYEDSGYVVRNQLGRPLHPETVSDYWDRLVAAAGVRRIRLQDACHTCGTLMHPEASPRR